MVADWKKDIVSGVGKRIKAHKVVGVVGVSQVPSKQMQSMRKSLKGQVEIIVSRGNLLKRSLAKAGVKGMDDYLKGPSGLVFSDLDPFKLEKLIYSCRVRAPAKPGSIAPYDLVVPEGDTGLPAGPVIGDLQGAGVKAKIQGGKIVVTEDSLVVKEGDPVNEKAAAVLARLGIEPMEIVLKLNAAYEAGMVYPGDILHIDEEETIAKLQSAHLKAFNLAYNARMLTKDTVTLLIQEASANARNLMLNAEIINKETIGIYLGRADAQAKALKAVIPDELKQEAEDKKEEPAEEKKKEEPEEKKEEPAAKENKEEKAPKEKKEEPAKEKAAEEKKEEDKAEKAPEDKKEEPAAKEKKE